VYHPYLTTFFRFKRENDHENLTTLVSYFQTGRKCPTQKNMKQRDETHRGLNFLLHNKVDVDDNRNK